MVWLQKLHAIYSTSKHIVTHLDVLGLKKRGQRKGKKGSQKATEKKLWGLCLERFFEDPTKLKKLGVPELNKYLKHHRLEKHLTRHWLLQMNPEGMICYKQDWEKETEAKLKMNLCQTVITTIVMKTIAVEAKAAVMRRIKMIALTLVIETNRVMSFLHSSMTKKKLRGQPQHVREEPYNQNIRNWFLSFQCFFQRIQSELTHFFFADFVVHRSLLYTTKSEIHTVASVTFGKWQMQLTSMKCNTLIMPTNRK